MMEWHKRFVQQAAWTKHLRSYLFERAGLAICQQGAGSRLRDGGDPVICLNTPAGVHGLDLEPGRLVEAHLHAPQAILACGDARLGVG